MNYTLFALALVGSAFVIALAVLLVFGTMGWAGIPLGVATSMFAGMTLGLGLDGAIHLHARFREIVAAGAVASDAAVAAWRSVGPAILVDTVAVGLGFAVLWTSAVPANARLGALLVLALSSTFAATWLFAPPLLARGRPVSRRT
jgi:predicted RND superfamily exporter protein